MEKQSNGSGGNGEGPKMERSGKDMQEGGGFMNPITANPGAYAHKAFIVGLLCMAGYAPKHASNGSYDAQIPAHKRKNH